jgi:histidyl-tRNA synthetase
VRLYYFGPMFRYDRPQAGRYRQLTQFGVECIGEEGAAADVEVIELQRTLYEHLGMRDLTLRINSIGTAETRRRYLDALREHLRPHLATMSRGSQRRYDTNVLRVLDSKEDAGHPAMQSAPSILDYLDEGDAAHFAEVRSTLDDLLVPYEVDSRIVRGLDYYARTVWEFEPAGAGGQSTVGAGGRYDGLMELLGGTHTPGVGFATGIERIVLNLRERGAIAPDPGLDLFIAPLGELGPRTALHLAREVRAAGLAVRAGFPGRGLRAYFRAAEASGARFIAIIGDNEAGRGVVQLKPLDGDAEQREVAVADVPLMVMPRW